jgi:hypothetical protein
MTRSRTHGSNGEHMAWLPFVGLFDPWVSVGFDPSYRELRRRFLVSVSLFGSI